MSTSLLSRSLIHARNFSVLNSTLLSGHNKWSSIKHDKAKNDVERNKLFSKFAQRISLAAKLGGSPDPNLNIRLATAIDLASKNNVTKKVIENAIKKGSGGGLANGKASTNMETCVYEGMGPGGIALVVEALTDNKNRTIGLVRSTFTKANGSMTPTLYFFDKRGYVVVNPPASLDTDEDKILESVLEVAGVEDMQKLQSDDPTDISDSYGTDVFEITSDTTMANSVASALKTKGFRIQELGMAYVPKKDMMVHVKDPETRCKVDKFLALLDEIEEVTDIYTNMQHP
ncbi:hypothetical protein HG535_0E03450 [Zygotorulaspora mrakii]|uniref:Transcriptional regulator TACO1-like protein n=1 Tax=Zygotorulaspora mrakii TaxID=42260 RepID=A0A7H9B3M7_ZYGMR|nr:uncharacterized protein HG535_0E03450 [Zygotorulaspora mrakii]QLG73261.1 hypothetical protein HG535_0E03450 [Zygotorulaspora mrakii]